MSESDLRISKIRTTRNFMTTQSIAAYQVLMKIHANADNFGGDIRVDVTNCDSSRMCVGLYIGSSSPKSAEEAEYIVNSIRQLADAVDEYYKEIQQDFVRWQEAGGVCHDRYSEDFME